MTCHQTQTKIFDDDDDDDDGYDDDNNDGDEDDGDCYQFVSTSVFHPHPRPIL